MNLLLVDRVIEEGEKLKELEQKTKGKIRGLVEAQVVIREKELE
jgi:hypothetical protein